jgi:hypothetical protein
MRHSTRRFRISLLVAALVIGAGAQAAIAQELTVDPKALDAAASVTTKRKGRKGAANVAPQSEGKPAAQKGGGPNRQFGELEGWSPGKEPPKPKDKEGGPAGTRAPVSVSPSGNLGTGFAF